MQTPKVTVVVVVADVCRDKVVARNTRGRWHAVLLAGASVLVLLSPLLKLTKGIKSISFVEVE
jgi:hypothetical protein